MLRIREGSALAGAGAIAFSVFAAPVSVVSLVVQSAPGGTYSESDVASTFAKRRPKVKPEGRRQRLLGHRIGRRRVDC